MEDIPNYENKNTLKKVAASLGLAGSLLAATYSITNIYNENNKDHIVKEAYDTLDLYNVEEVEDKIAVMPEAFSSNDMRSIYGNNEVREHKIKTDNGKDVLNVSFEDDCTYYKIPIGYQMYAVEKEASIPGMYGIIKATDIDELGNYHESCYAVINNNYSLDGAMAVYYPYVALLTEKDRLLSSKKMLNLYERDIVSDAMKVEEQLKEIYNNYKEEIKSL